MTLYNLSTLTNASDVVVLTQNVNTHLMDGWLGTLLLFVVLVIMFLGFYWSTREAQRSLATTCFIGFFMSLLLVALGLVSTLVVFILLIASAFSVAFLNTSQD